MSKIKLQTSIKTIKQNIQGIDLSADQSFFITVSKLQSNITSMFDYYVSIYDLETLDLKKQAYVYSTYKQAKHPCVILSNMKAIIVSTFQHIYFYDQNLNLKHKQAHNQQNIQDMEASPDSKLLVVVGGNNVILWDPLTYKRFIFSQISQYSKVCKFSKDSSKLGISTGKNLYIYSIPADLSSALIPQPTVISSQSGKVLTQPQRRAGVSEEDQRQATDSLGSGQINYFDFSPINNQLIAISFGNLSPKLYNIQDVKYQSLSLNQQPHVVGNAKYLHFMPDGKRVFSSDDRGYGLWSGSDKNLVYIEDNRIHQLKSYSQGKKLLGHRWFQIVKIQIKSQCGDKSYSTTCPCQANFYWDLAAQKCSPCQRLNINICQCKDGQNFIPEFGRCVFNCSAKKNTLKYLTTGIPDLACICDRGYFLRNNQCVFECNHMFEIGMDKDSNSCVCKPSFVWNNVTKQCECLQNSQLVRDSNQEYVCECLFQYVRDQFDKCIPDCKIKRNALDERDQFGNCRCQPGFQFIKYQNMSTTFQFNKNYSNKLYFQATNGDCVRNCSMLNDTIGNVDIERCSCRQYMYWSNNVCNLNCQKLPNGGASFVQDGMQSCPCANPYTWVPQIKQCGRSCKEFKFINTSKFSNSKTCPCMNKFFWTSYGNIGACKIDCQGKVNDSLQNNPLDNSTCICKDAFFWNETSFSCQIDCQKIWDADQRISSNQCSCKNNKLYNKEKRICQATSVEGVFGKPWIWAILGIGILFAIIVAVVMIKFCWKFSNNSQNKQHNKKLKKRTEPPVRKKRQKNQIKATPSERAPIKQ